MQQNLHSSSTRGVISTGGRGGRAWPVVAVLTGLTVVAFVDRQILSVLVDGVRADLAISDVQVGWLVGPAFIVTYNLVLLPLSTLIDRVNRMRLLTAGILLWGLMTFCSAFVHSFFAFVACRSGLAIGEALLGPTAVSLIGDLFGREHRALPMAVYMTGSTVGQTGAAFFGAAALQAVSGGIVLPFIGSPAAWRLALMFVALPAFVLAAVFLLVGKEPARGGTAMGAAEATREHDGMRAHLRLHWPAYLMIALSSSLVNMLAVNIAVWGPAYLIRDFARSAVAAGYEVGGISVVAGVAGCLSLPLLIRLRARNIGRSAATMESAIGATLIAVPGVLLFGLATAPAVVLVGLAVAVLALSTMFSIPSQFVQLNTPSRLRAKIMSGMLFIIFLVSAGVGPVLTPTIAGRFFTGPAALGHAMAVIALGAALIALPLLLALRQRLITAAPYAPTRGGLCPITPHHQ